MKKKIVHLQVLPILSGVQRITLNIYKNLDPERYEMYLICAKTNNNEEPSLISEAQKLGVKVIALKELKRDIGFHDFSAFIKLYKIFQRYRFDIIHTHSSKTGFLGRIAGKFSGCKCVIHTVHGTAFHDYEHPVRRSLYYILEIFAGLFNDRVVLVNKYYRSKFWFIPSQKIVTVYNGINLEELKSKKERNDGKIRLISVGRLDKPKSPVDLIEALKIVINKRDDIEAWIIGDGDYYNYLKEYIAKHELVQKVKLLGWRQDVPHLLAECDIFVGSSIYEAFGLVYCEAGYTGLPVVATNVEGIPEVVLDKKTGILVAPRESKALAEAILFLAENKELSDKMGNEAREWIKEKFNLTKFVGEYKEIYESF